MKAHRDPRRLTRASRTTSPTPPSSDPLATGLYVAWSNSQTAFSAHFCASCQQCGGAPAASLPACLLAEFPNPPSLSAPRTHALAVHIPVSRMVVMPDNSKNTLINSPSNGVWTSHLKLPHFRVLNQTCACCTPAPSAPVDHPL